MPFEKGQSGNPAGRPPGSQNRINGEIRQRIVNFLDSNFDNLLSDLNEVEPKERVRFYIDLLQFGLPKLKLVELEGEFNKITDKDLDIIIELLKDERFIERTEN